MDVQHCLKLCVRCLLYDVVPSVAGVIDDDVERPEVTKMGIDQPLWGCRFGKVSGKRSDLKSCFTQASLGLRKFCFIDIGEKYGSPGMG